MFATIKGVMDRHKQAVLFSVSIYPVPDIVRVSLHDIPFLVAEIKLLQAENLKLRQERKKRG